MWPIIVTAPLELLHIDFTSIKTMMELDQPPNMVNLLVLQPVYKHIMAYVTPDQTTKTVAKFFVARLHLDLHSTSQASEWLRSQLWKQHHQRALQAYAHTEG